MVKQKKFNHFLVFLGALCFICLGTQGFTQVRIMANDQVADDIFSHGTSGVAISGNWALVGAIHTDDNGVNSGSAYIFRHNAAGNWVQFQELHALDAAAGDAFGRSVSIDYNYAIIGAHENDDLGAGSGSAYIFRYDGNTWTQQQELNAGAFGAAEDYFGSSVSISGVYAIVGSYNDDNVNGNEAGSAYIFERDGNNWIRREQLLASDGQAGDWFGASVAISGDYAIVGAFYEDDVAANAGAAYIFEHMGNDWVERQILRAPDGAAFDYFGYSVSIHNGIAVVGAVATDDNQNNSGSAYIYQRFGDNWMLMNKIHAGDPGASDDFGNSVAVHGNFIIVGARDNDDIGINSGSAYIFRRNGFNWVQAWGPLVFGAAGDWLGQSVAISGDYVIAGAPYFDTAAGIDVGCAYIFDIEIF